MRPLKHDLIEAEISLAPLIDVCLVLMIILLVVVPMVRVGVAASLPESAQGGQAAASRLAAAPRPGLPGPSVLALDPPQLAIAIRADGTLVVEGRIVQPADLQRILGEIWAATPNRPVLIKGDRRLRYEQVRWVLQSVNAAGFRRAGLVPDRAGN